MFTSVTTRCARSTCASARASSALAASITLYFTSCNTELTICRMVVTSSTIMILGIVPRLGSSSTQDFVQDRQQHFGIEGLDDPTRCAGGFSLLLQLDAVLGREHEDRGELVFGQR